MIRFMIAVGNAQLLSLPDPVLGIPLRYAVLAVGTLELALALFCLFGKTTSFQVLWVVWLSGDYILYKCAAFWMHCKPQTTCIGALTNPLHLATENMGLSIECLPYLGVIGGLWALLCFWRETASAKTPAFIKMFCPSCGGKIRFPGADLGRRLACPLCKSKIQLRKPEFLRMSCAFCKAASVIRSKVFSGDTR
jgi:hypothetical protein